MYTLTDILIVQYYTRTFIVQTFKFIAQYYCHIYCTHLSYLYNLSRILLYTLIGKLTVQFSRIVIVQSYLYNLSRIFIVHSYTSTLTVQSFQLVYIVHFYICTFIVHSCRYIYNTVYHLNYCTTLDVNPSIMRLRPRPFCNFNHLHIYQLQSTIQYGRLNLSFQIKSDFVNSLELPNFVCI